MRPSAFRRIQLGVWDGQQVLDASAAVADCGHHSAQEMMEMVIGDWANTEPRIRDAIDSAQGIALEDVCCRPPLPRPGQLVCLAGNYLEPQKPERGLFNAFLKSPNAALGHGGTVVLPDAEASVFHFEPELRWSSASGPAAFRPRRRWTTFSATRSSWMCRPGGCPAAFPGKVVAYVRADGSAAGDA